MTSTAQTPTGEQGAFDGYTQEELPLGGYGVLLGVFGALTAGFLAGIHRSRRELPKRIPVRDVALLGAASYRATRLLSKDLVTSPLRAPFVRFEELTGPNEVKESARGSGLRQAIGELLICPYCVGAWVAAGFVGGHVVAPRATRVVASTLVVHGISDELYNRLS